MDLPHIDWHWLGTILGGGVVAAASRFLGIAQRMQALENRVDTQGQLMADQRDEISRLRRLVGKQDKALLDLQRALADERRRSGELTERVAQLELERDTALAKAADTAAKAKLLIAQWEADKARPSHDTMPPPGGKPR